MKKSFLLLLLLLLISFSYAQTWKVPIVYAGLYASYYFFSEFNTDYNIFRSDILLVQDTTNHDVITASGIYGLSELEDKYDEYRRKRDLAFIGGVLVWGLNILDAYIDAELSNFDVSEDLSIRIKPSINYFNPYNPNLSLTVQFYF